MNRLSIHQRYLIQQNLAICIRLHLQPRIVISLASLQNIFTGLCKLLLYLTLERIM